MAAALPDHDVLSGDLGRTALAGNAEGENAALAGHVAPGLDLDGMKKFGLEPGIDGALPEGLNRGTAIDALPSGWEKSGVFTIEAGNGCAIPSIEGNHKLNHSFIDVCAGLAGHYYSRQQNSQRVELRLKLPQYLHVKTYHPGSDNLLKMNTYLDLGMGQTLDTNIFKSGSIERATQQLKALSFINLRYLPLIYCDLVNELYSN